MARKRRNSDSQLLQPVAGNGLLDRRLLLTSGMVFAGAVTTGVGGIATRAAAEPLAVDPWSKTIGATVPGYSTPSRFEAKVVKTLGDATRPKGRHAMRRAGVSTPGHALRQILPRFLQHRIISL